METLNTQRLDALERASPEPRFRPCLERCLWDLSCRGQAAWTRTSKVPARRTGS